MALLDREKLALLKTLSTNLANESLADLNMLLAEADIATIEDRDWAGSEWENYEVSDDDRRQILIHRLRQLNTPELAHFADVTGSILNLQIDVSSQETKPEPLRVFASHRDGQKAHVHEVADFLKLLHITMFVAHDDINPGEEWVDRIEAELRTSHAGVVFLIPGFEKSTFCDQEVGWMRGRGIPLYTLKYQTAFPYGFFGRKQAQHVPDAWKARDIANNIATWLSVQVETSENFATSIAQSIQSATSFESANKRFAFVEHRTDFSAPQVAAVAVAVRDNSQIFNAEYRPDGKSTRENLAHRILRFLKDQPGFEANAELISEVADAHDIDDLDLILAPTTADVPF